MSNAMTPMRVARGISQSLCIVVLLLTCCALSAQNTEHRVRNIVLVHGAWADGSAGKGLRHPCQGWLQRQHRPRTGDVL